MCGRFTLTMPDFEEIAELLGVTYDAQLAARYRPRYNVAPSDAHWMVAAEGDHRRILPARWGYGSKRLPLVRGEMAARQFKRAFELHRVLVPADGFFEWTGEKGARVPHWFHPTSPGLVLLGGIGGEGPEGFGLRGSAEGGTRVCEFALLTTRPNATVSPVHDRMPVIVPLADADRWLRGDVETAQALVRPAVDDLLVDTIVGARVNNARNDDPECLLPANDVAPRQGSLF